MSTYDFSLDRPRQDQIYDDIDDQMSGPYYTDPQQPTTTVPSTNTYLDNAMTTDNWFWETEGSFNLANGMQVNGTYQQLYMAYPELQQQIFGFYQGVTLADTNSTGVTEYAGGGQDGSLLPAQQEQNDVFAEFMKVDPVEAERSAEEALLGAVDVVSAKAPERAMQPDLDGVGGEVVVKASAAEIMAGLPGFETSLIEDHETDVEQVDEAVEELDSSEATAAAEEAHEAEKPPSPKDAADSAEKAVTSSEAPASAAEEIQASPPSPASPADLPQAASQSAPRRPSADAPQYITDIASPAEAHAIIDHPDPTFCRKLSMTNDDFADIKASQLHIYAKKFFDALLTPGVEEPTDLALRPEAKKKFQQQQSANLKKIQNMMGTEAQQKEARANCILAFEAALFVHEVGVPRDLYDQIMTRGVRKSDRYAHLDAKSICSERLELMVQQIADYKAVAIDLLQGKKMHRLVYDPVYYGEQKLMYLVSNTIRQATTDKLKPKKEKKREEEKEGKEIAASKSGAKAPTKAKASAKTGGKRKRTAEAEPEEDYEDDQEEDGEDNQEEDYEEPVTKRAKQSARKSG